MLHGASLRGTAARSLTRDHPGHTQMCVAAIHGWALRARLWTAARAGIRTSGASRWSPWRATMAVSPGVETGEAPEVDEDQRGVMAPPAARKKRNAWNTRVARVCCCGHVERRHEDRCTVANWQGIQCSCPEFRKATVR